VPARDDDDDDDDDETRVWKCKVKNDMMMMFSHMS